jgi:hypothetical protein
MPEVDIREFDERLNGRECSQVIRDIVARLRKTADQAGPAIWRAHSTPGGGWGITGKRANRVFCRFDPKPSVPHVCVSVVGADEDGLKAAGTVHRRKNAESWVDVADMRGANLLEPLIAHAYAAAGVALNPHVERALSRPAAAALVQRAHDVGAPGRLTSAENHEHQIGADDPPSDVRKELDARGFVHAGVIRPLDSGKSCRAEINSLGLRGSVVYSLVVRDEFKKCGDTGRKGATLASRMSGCANTINQILRGDLKGPFTEHFKSRAPRVIAAGQEIDVWAREATADECDRLQKDLNERYDTIRVGWANKLK